MSKKIFIHEMLIIYKICLCNIEGENTKNVRYELEINNCKGKRSRHEAQNNIQILERMREREQTQLYYIIF